MLRIVCFSFLLSLFILPSCKNLVPYTDALRKQNNWSDAEIQRIQFYTSEEIVLYRELVSGSTQIVSGKIKKMNGREIEEIVIKRNTPGVVTEIPKEGKMYVSFEIGDSYYLSFGLNPEQRGRYVLLAKEWTKGGIGKVTYNGVEFQASPSSAAAYLQVDMRRRSKEAMDARVAKGRKVN